MATQVINPEVIAHQPSANSAFMAALEMWRTLEDCDGLFKKTPEHAELLAAVHAFMERCTKEGIGCFTKAHYPQSMG